MIKIFSRSTLAQLFFIFATMALLWAKVFNDPMVVISDADATLYRLVAGWIAPYPLAALMLTLTGILAEGLWLNFLLARSGLVSNNSLLPAFLYLLMMSTPARTLPPALFVNAALILYADRIMIRGTLLTIPTEKISSAACLIGICTLFYLPSAALLLSYILVAVNYRLYGWRDWVALLLGLIAPYVVLVAVFWFSGTLPAWWTSTTEAIAGLRPRIADATPLRTIANLLVAAAVVASMAVIAGKLGERPVVWQKNALAVLLCTVGAVAMLLLTQPFPADYHFFAVSFALSGTSLLASRPTAQRRKRKHDWLPDILLILLMASILLC